MEPVIISASGVSKRYSLREKAPLLSFRNIKKLLKKDSEIIEPSDEFWALKDISFEIKKGQRVGIIGRNGAGKSTLLKILSRLVCPTEGEIIIHGRVTSLLEVGTGFNMNLSGRENIYLNASLHGLGQAEIDAIYDAIVEFSGVRDFLDLPVKRYSSGMYMRLAFAVAAHLQTDILILDEVLAVGDMAFQRKCLERVDEMTASGRTLLFVSHSMDALSRYCDRCIWLDRGAIQMEGDVMEVISSYAEAVLNINSLTYIKSSDENSVEINKSSNKATGTENKLPQQPNASLISARIIDSKSQTKKIFRVDEPVGIEMVFETFEAGCYVPAIHVYCPQNTLVFAAIPPQTELSKFEYDESCRSISTAWLPVNLFNIGTYSVSLVVFSPLEAPFERYFVHERVLSFHCIDAPLGFPSAKGIMPRGFPGPVRPLLEWTIFRSNN